MTDTTLVDRLAAHRTLGTAPREELEWLARAGELRRYAVGDVVSTKVRPTVEMLILLTGDVVQYVARAQRGGLDGTSALSTGRRKFMEWRAGEVTGLLPFSRMTFPPGDSVIEQPTEALVIQQELFPELARECPAVTRMLVHVMLDRARDFTSNHFQDEKMMSLGRLSAGLAHELNNPASAAARSARLLASALAESEAASGGLATAQLTDTQRDAIERVCSRAWFDANAATELSPIERSDLEDQTARWLEARAADPASAATLVDAGVTTEALNDLSAALPGPALDVALRWIVAGCTTRALAHELERGATRIHDLVSAVKRFTYMDRATVSEPASITQGLADTVTMLAAKARAKDVTVTLDVPPDLPAVRAFGGELNQVWANLLDNALDAAPMSGHVLVSATCEGDRVVVRVRDDGAGVKPEIRGRIFDPFFTTKPVGEGAGLGLDIASRIVRRHDGDIDVDSEPGRTEFRVAIPVTEAVPGRD